MRHSQNGMRKNKILLIRLIKNKYNFPLIKYLSCLELEK